MPPSALLRMQSAARAQAIHSCYLAAELLEILKRFRDAGIPALALKGPVLAMLAYGSPSDRDFCDIDILVRPDNLERAGLLLHDSGYRTDTKTCPSQGCPASGCNHDVFIHDERGIVIELHWRLTLDCDRIPLEGTDVWSRAQVVSVLNQPVATLSTEDTLVFLCVHGSKHCWSRLKWRADIAQLVNSAKEIDWKALILRSKRIGCRRMLVVSIGVAARLFGSALPPAIAALVRVDPVAQSLIQQIVSDLTLRAKFSDPKETTRHLRMRERFGDQFLLFMRLLRRICRLTSEDGLPQNHTAVQFLAAVCARPIRLYRKYGFGWAKPLFP